MRVIWVLSLVAAMSAAASGSQRIVGGEVTSIERYPQMAALLVAWPSWFMQECGGTVLNNRAILSAAHCFRNDPPSDWQIRLGSTNSNSGGTVYLTSQIILHPDFTRATFDSDIAILRTVVEIVFSNVISPGDFAGPSYNVADNAEVWAAGWGRTNIFSSMSAQLRHVQVWTINREICNTRYQGIRTVTQNMLCSGWLDVGGRDQCGGDSGGPVFHNGVVVGVCSWGEDCGHSFYPGVNALVSPFSSWIESNA